MKLDKGDEVWCLIRFSISEWFKCSLIFMDSQNFGIYITD